MSLIDTSYTGFLERYLDLATFRQTLVSANLANIDTPGYRSVDVAFQSELVWASFNNSYMQPLHPVVRCFNGLMEGPDGKKGSLDREGRFLAQTQLQYKAAV